MAYFRLNRPILKTSQQLACLRYRHRPKMSDILDPVLTSGKCGVPVRVESNSKGTLAEVGAAKEEVYFRKKTAEQLEQLKIERALQATKKKGGEKMKNREKRFQTVPQMEKN